MLNDDPTQQVTHNLGWAAWGVGVGGALGQVVGAAACEPPDASLPSLSFQWRSLREQDLSPGRFGGRGGDRETREWGRGHGPRCRPALAPPDAYRSALYSAAGSRGRDVCLVARQQRIDEGAVAGAHRGHGADHEAEGGRRVHGGQVAGRCIGAANDDT